MLASVLFLTFLVVLAIARERRARRAFAGYGPAFECRIRSCGPASVEWPRLRRRWSRRLWARWSGEVLEIRRGPVLDRTLRLAAQVSPKGVYVLPDPPDLAFEPAPIAVQLRTAAGAVIEVTAGETARAELVGAYVAAAFNDLPRAPSRRQDN
jgi:hypothetical protein